MIMYMRPSCHANEAKVFYPSNSIQSRVESWWEQQGWDSGCACASASCERTDLEDRGSRKVRIDGYECSPTRAAYVTVNTLEVFQRCSRTITRCRAKSNAWPYSFCDRTRRRWAWSSWPRHLVPISLTQSTPLFCSTSSTPSNASSFPRSRAPPTLFLPSSNLVTHGCPNLTLLPFFSRITLRKHWLRLMEKTGAGFYSLLMGRCLMWQGNFAGRDASRGMAKQSFDLGKRRWHIIFASPSWSPRLHTDMLTPLDQPIDKLTDLVPSEMCVSLFSLKCVVLTCCSLERIWKLGTNTFPTNTSYVGSWSRTMGFPLEFVCMISVLVYIA